MEIVKRFGIRHLSEPVTRINFAGRTVDFWAPAEPATHLIVAHDGQNIFDRRTATRGRTWQLAQNASRVATEFGISAPLIIAIFHGTTKSNPWGRAHDLAPQEPFQAGLVVAQPKYRDVSLADLQGDNYLETIVSEIVPAISQSVGFIPEPSKTALLGSSMGGLATLYGLGRHPEFFGAGLAFSPHWIIGENPLVDALLDALPMPSNHKIWLSRGTKGLDAEYQPFHDYSISKLKELGWQESEQFEAKIFAGGRHNEPSWRRQSDEALRFWLS
ncbi:MAG: alpha/beta hydrolase-fold protein [Actinomycetes bacterium]